MTCKKHEAFDLGRIDRKAFLEHADNCPECQEFTAWDESLLEAAKKLKTPVQAPYLWQRIETALSEEKKTAFSWFSRQAFLRWGTAATLGLVIVVGAVLLFSSEAPRSGLLEQKALAKIEKKESRYVEAIEELEDLVIPKMAELDLELMFLYRDKLETIDQQIIQCREAIEENPANAHIRRYLMAALQDKRATLSEIMTLGNGT
jgi:hypothetical protein